MSNQCYVSKLNEGELNGERFGTGIYVSYLLETAESYSREFKMNHSHYKVVLECRVRPGYFETTTSSRGILLIEDERDVRLCGILIKLTRFWRSSRSVLEWCHALQSFHTNIGNQRAWGQRHCKQMLVLDTSWCAGVRCSLVNSLDCRQCPPSWDSILNSEWVKRPFYMHVTYNHTLYVPYNLGHLLSFP